MEKYKISVIVPTYNSGLFLNAFFDSIMYQSIGFENIEVIFVDDCSDDDYTLYLLNLFDENFSNVKSVLLDENNGFPGKGRNIGLNLANSEYVIFSDHDDTYTPKAFEVMYNTARENNTDMLITNYYKVFPDTRESVKTVFNGENVSVESVEDDTRLFSIDPAIWCKLFRKDFLLEKNISFLEGMLAEDLYFFIVSLFKSSCTVYLDDFYSYNYNIRNVEGDRSTIHIRNKKYLGKMVEGYFETDKFLTENDLTQYYTKIFNMHFIYWITSLIFSNVSDKDKIELISYINELLKKDVEIVPGFNERIYYSLTQPILDDDYKKVVKSLNAIKRYRYILIHLPKNYFKLRSR
ncbi:glycosyltransferase family 2 protein [uncultured Methanobrevibacter sp.]|uniref:glycosyltransferase family 2 protein n=1 Tax=uncultured Methanobrevibacter sp. TaxID=253161 RepID=UPI0025E710FD|nr:glycosyltransferase family 2 protein [uncultured Methanobrevibacter sp.]